MQKVEELKLKVWVGVEEAHQPHIRTLADWVILLVIFGDVPILQGSTQVILIQQSLPVKILLDMDKGKPQ